jgi:hypothetical protein
MEPVFFLCHPARIPMATQQPGAPAPERDTPSVGKQVLLLTLVSAAAILLFRLLASDNVVTDLLQKPQAVQLTYVPSDFKPDLNEEATLQILAQPEKYRKEFDALVYNFNLALLYHVANRMSLDDSLKRQLEPEYKKHHDYLKTLYFNDFVALKDTTAYLYENWYQDNTNQAVRIFNEVAGKYTCFFVTQILATLLKVTDGALLAKGRNVDNPCGIAINEALRPMVERLQTRAAILDFSASRGMLKDKVRKGIAELATFEVRSRMGLDKTLSYKFFGIPISQTDIRIEAMSVIKAGFKLDENFDVTFNPRKGIVYVTLPPPTILSHEVYPRVDKLDVGFLAGIDEQEMNRNLNELRRQFRQDAIENEHILQRAQERADTVMQMILGPVVKSMGKNYRLELRFRGDAPPPVDSSPPAESPRRRQFIPQ